MGKWNDHLRSFALFWLCGLMLEMALSLAGELMEAFMLSNDCVRSLMVKSGDLNFCGVLLFLLDKSVLGVCCGIMNGFT